MRLKHRYETEPRRRLFSECLRGLKFWQLSPSSQMHLNFILECGGDDILTPKKSGGYYSTVEMETLRDQQPVLSRSLFDLLLGFLVVVLQLHTLYHAIILIAEADKTPAMERVTK